MLQERVGELGEVMVQVRERFVTVEDTHHELEVESFWWRKKSLIFASSALLPCICLVGLVFKAFAGEQAMMDLTKLKPPQITLCHQTRVLHLDDFFTNHRVLSFLVELDVHYRSQPLGACSSQSTRKVPLHQRDCLLLLLAGDSTRHSGCNGSDQVSSFLVGGRTDPGSSSEFAGMFRDGYLRCGSEACVSRWSL
ncbi:Uncharacterized protein Rs2_27667 [Raphanus sativus]|nr:Uncharacterized protein Rs2_27667 [Raphanus sativus]